jgi:TolB-like protein
MERDNRSSAAEQAAARWFVDLDTEAVDPAAEAGFAAWLARDRAHETAFERCEAALLLTKVLGDEARLGGAFDAAARLAAARPRARVAQARAWLARPALAWGVAALAAVVAVLAIVYRGERAADAGSIAAGPPEAADSAYTITFDLGGAEPVVLPGAVIVDARSLAVLPFVDIDAQLGTSSGESRAIAAALHDQVVRALAAIPGIYVVGSQSVAAYGDLGVVPEVMAAQLGVRGIVEARVTATDGRVRVSLRVIDAARDRLLLEDAFDRPVEELTAMRSDIVTNIAVALGGTPRATGPMAIHPQ